MTAKFDAFMAALTTLCNEHRVGIYIGYEEASVIDLDEGEIFSDPQLDDQTIGTPEEVAAKEAERQREREEWERREAADREAYQKMHQDELARLMQTSGYSSLNAIVEAHSILERRKFMRIAKDPADPAYIDDRPRRIWVNDREVLDWTVADEFRRVVQTPTGNLFGAVMIERLPEPGEPETPEQEELSTSICGMFVHAPDPKPEPAPAAQPAKPAAKSTGKRKGRK